MAAASSHQWLASTVSATVCWAFSDICSDVCINQNADVDEDKENARARNKAAKAKAKDASKSKPAPTRRKLCGEEKAFISGAITLIFGCLGGVGVDIRHVPLNSALLSVLAGMLHFVSYYYTLKAFNSAPSTMITPLLQLSAVFMLPMSALAAIWGFSDRPVISALHVQAVIFITVGGFLPLAEGDFSKFLRKEFWQHPALKSCLLAELLVCIYNMFLHHLTYDTNQEQVVFFLSNLGNGLMCLLLWAFSLNKGTLVLTNGNTSDSAAKQQSSDGRVSMCSTTTVTPRKSKSDAELKSTLTVHSNSSGANAPLLVTNGSSSRSLSSSKVLPLGKRFVAIAVFGELLSLVGLWLGNMSYAHFYEPSVVNAAEGGLQQMFNLVFAMIMYRCMPTGRKITDVPVKLISFCLVSFGLFLSTQ